MNIRDINAIQARLYSGLGFLLVLSLCDGFTGTWPRFLGPTQNSHAIDENLPDEWGANGPTQLWEHSVGRGFSGPIALDDRIILFHREDNHEVIVSLDPKTGSQQWRFAYATSYRDDFGFDDGPRSTPTAANGLVYTYGAQGRLQCLELKTGKPVWHVDARRRFEAPKGFFGIACSPLVEGDVVILNIGHPRNGGIVAFDRLTGATKWKASEDAASYSSPVSATISGSRQILVFDRMGLKVVEPRSGLLRATYPWRPSINASVNAASPVVNGDQVLLTTSYNTGAIVLDLSGKEPRKVWSNDDALSCHYGTPVRREGHLYGFHGRQEWGADFHCVDWTSGAVVWRARNIVMGTVTCVGDRLIILQENGELVMADADPTRYRERDRAQILPSGVRAYPAFANGVIYARSPKKLVAVKIGGEDP